MVNKDDNMDECSECDGTGEIEVKYPASRIAEEPDIRSHPCPACQLCEPDWEPGDMPEDYYDNRRDLDDIEF